MKDFAHVSERQLMSSQDNFMLRGLLAGVVDVMAKGESPSDSHCSLVKKERSL